MQLCGTAANINFGIVPVCFGGYIDEYAFRSSFVYAPFFFWQQFSIAAKKSFQIVSKSVSLNYF